MATDLGVNTFNRSYDRNTPSTATLKLIAQAEKIHMFRRMSGTPGWTRNIKEMIRRHLTGVNDFACDDVTCGDTKNTWRVKSVDAKEGSVLVTHIEGTDFLCDCIDYPAEYVCEDCKICIHMYMCSCQEVDQYPSLICKHIHSAVHYGEGIIQKPNISTHTKTPHRSPGHLWPNPMIYRFNIKCGKLGSPKTLVPVSSDSINIDKQFKTEIFQLPRNWKSDSNKGIIAQEQIRNDIKLNCMKKKLESDVMGSIMMSTITEDAVSNFVKFKKALEIDPQGAWEKYKHLSRCSDSSNDSREDSSDGDTSDEDSNNSIDDYDDDFDGNASIVLDFNSAKQLALKERLWNVLPANIKEIKNEYQFKQKVKEFLKNQENKIGKESLSYGRYFFALLVSKFKSAELFSSD